MKSGLIEFLPRDGEAKESVDLPFTLQLAGWQPGVEVSTWGVFVELVPAPQYAGAAQALFEAMRPVQLLLYEAEAMPKSRRVVLMSGRLSSRSVCSASLTAGARLFVEESSSAELTLS